VITYNLLSAMKKFNSKAKLIYLSSIHADSNSVYGISKKLTEIMLESFSAEHRKPITVFRLTNVFGEGCKPFYCSVIATFCHQVAKGEKLSVNPNDKKFKFLYVGDLVGIIIKELATKRKINFYLKTVSSSNEISIPDLAKLILSFKKGKPQLKLKFYKDLYKTYLSYQHKSV